MFDNFNFDKRKVVILSLVFVLISISYINYMINKNSLLQSSSEFEEFEENQMEILEEKSNNENIVTHENINDDNTATSSIALVEEETEVVDSQRNEVDNIIAVSNENIEETLLNNENHASKYFLQAKIDIEIEREQTIERFDDIINNNLVDEESRKKVVSKKMNLIDNMNKEKIIESLIKGKGFEDAVVFITDKSVYVTVKSNDMTNADVAKILDVVNRETEISIDNIKIQNR